MSETYRYYCDTASPENPKEGDSFAVDSASGLYEYRYKFENGEWNRIVSEGSLIATPKDGQEISQTCGDIRHNFIAKGGEWHLKTSDRLYFCESLNHGDCILPIEI